MKNQNKHTTLPEENSNGSSVKETRYRQEDAAWMDISFLIAARIQRALHKKQLSQVWLAGELGYSPQYIHKVMKGRENLSLKTIAAFEKVLGITLVAVPALTRRDKG